VKSWPIKAKRWALVIGVDQYRDGQINALKGSVNDAHNLAGALVGYAGFPQDQVIVLTTDQPEERQPTRINILTYLSNLASLVPKDGLLLVSFAGHGIERGGQAYLIPSDARLSHDVSLLEESAVSVTRMHDRIKAIGVGQVIVLLDACRNDPGGRADAPNNMSAAYAKFNFDVRNREVQAFATLYATAIGQRAYEYTEKRQGYFTWAVVEGLKGGAANEKGEVTLSALVKYVQDNVPKRIAIDLGGNEHQKPFATIDGYRADELVIAVAGPSAVTPNVTSITPGIDPAAVELSFWESIKNSSDPADFQAYLNKYPNGVFVELATRRVRSGGIPGSIESSSSRMPTADEIIEANIQATAAPSAYDNVKTTWFKGRFEVVMGSKTEYGAIEVTTKAPNKSLTIMNYDHGPRVTETYDGSVGWLKEGRSLKPMTAHQLGVKKRGFLSPDLKTFKDLYPEAKLKSKVKIGDRETYALELTTFDGGHETWYVDSETFLVIRQDSLFETYTGTDVPTKTFMEDYAEVGGIKMPFVYRQENRGSTFTIRYIDVKYNVPVDEKIFGKP
jgi:hypothetical protein